MWNAVDHKERQKEVQGWLEREAEAWRRRGVMVRTDHMRMCIDHTWLTCNEREGEPALVKEMRGKAKKSFRNRGNEEYDRE